MAALRRLLLIVAVLGASAAAYTWWRRHDETAGAGTPEWPPFPEVEPEPGDQPTPEWPPFPEVEPEPGDQPTPETTTPTEAEPAWVAPVDGACPVSHPVKVNETSGIFHAPGGRFYERTKADRCYTSAEAAAADGYRASKA